MTELSLTRIFSVTMYYHFAFLAISIALFGLSASGVYAYVMRHRFDKRSTGSLLTLHSLLFAAATVLALAAIGIIGWNGHQRHSIGQANLPHDDDTPEDRHRFLGFATLLLSALSAVAVVYAALVAVFIRSCY